MSAVKPFLKWAGGKRQLLPHLRAYYPESFGAYIEPFLGSGAVFFDLWNCGLLKGKPAFLIDSSVDLMGSYQAVRDQVDEVISELNSLQRRHAREAHSTFYDIRRRFNSLRMNSTARTSETYGPQLASMLIYLNRTGFNGLFRLNSRRSFNVPLGRYSNPNICDEDNLRAVSQVLNVDSVRLRCGSYTLVLDAAAGDFVYLDPPYAPLSATANFRSYTAEGFNTHDQKRLRDVVLQLARRNCRVLLSNSSAPEIGRLYEENADARRAGLTVTRVKARRPINSEAGSRGAIDEFLISNI